jgi:hypothetical protein
VSRLVFLDTETTGLNPWHHEVWEIAVITRKVIEHEDQPTQTVDEEHVFHVKPDLTKADPTALRICRYYERTRARRVATGGSLSPYEWRPHLLDGPPTPAPALAGPDARRDAPRPPPRRCAHRRRRPLVRRRSSCSGSCTSTARPPPGTTT